MSDFAEFEAQLHETLNHLYDPTHQPGALLSTLLGRRLETARAIINQGIEALQPAPDAPAAARSWRLYKVLRYRYGQMLTQEQTAESLGITPRHLRREQQDAIHALAQQLWTQSQLASPRPAEQTPTMPPPAPEDDPTATFRAQVRQELAALQQSAPGAVADVAQTINGVMPMGQALAARYGVNVQSEQVEPTLTVALPPSVLRQILLTAIEKLAQQMAGGQIQIAAALAEENVVLMINADPVADARPPDSLLIEEIVALYGRSFQIKADNTQSTWWISLPTARRAVVLVVDDNTDLVHFYRRYVTNTRYEISHVAQGQDLFAAIERYAPDVIVLDVMLPDIDGWELLGQLHAHAATCQIPVIICSVVRRQELAATLHAALYVAKPVRRQEFIGALDQVLRLPAEVGRTTPV